MTSSSANTTPLDGFVSPHNGYSPRTALRSLNALVRPLTNYPALSLWEQDTRSLPRGLAQYRRQCRRFAEHALAPHSEVLDRLGSAHHPDREKILQGVLCDAAQQGYLTDLLPAPLGSVPWHRYRYPLAWQQAIKVEEFSRVCGGLMLLLSAHNLGIAPILMSGQITALRRFVLPAYRQTRAGSPHLFAFAITEPGAGSDAEEGHGASTQTPGMVATRVSGGWSLSGRKCFISGGDRAESITLFSALEGEGIGSWTCFLVNTQSPGFKVVRNELKMGMRASGATEIELDKVFVADAHIVGKLRQGWALNRATLNLSRIPVAAMAVGFAMAATDQAIDFACQYTLNGKPLVNYQEVQLQLADMIAETSAIRSLVWQSANTWRPTQRQASLSKFYCTDVAVKVCERAMELLGNHAALYDNRVEKQFRDARLTQIFEGTNQINHLALIEDCQEELLARVKQPPPATITEPHATPTKRNA